MVGPIRRDVLACFLLVSRHNMGTLTHHESIYFLRFAIDIASKKRYIKHPSEKMLTTLTFNNTDSLPSHKVINITSNVVYEHVSLNFDREEKIDSHYYCHDIDEKSSLYLRTEKLLLRNI